MWAALLAGLKWLAVDVLGAALKSLADAVLTARQQDQARADQEALGKSVQAATDLGKALDAASRMEQANAVPTGPSETRKMLDEGRF